LHDKNKKNKITIQLTETIKSKLESGRYYHLEGYINKGQNITNDSRLQVFFRPTKLLKHEAEVQLISQHEYDIVRERFNREFPIIQDILLDKIEKGEHPVIDIIMGLQSTSQEDYLSQLDDLEYYDIRHHRCNLSSQTDIIDFIRNYDFKDTDVLVILRGGGSGLEVFNELELCKKMIELPVPFITGIGHHEDVTLLQRVSDKAFSTPTSVGVFLQKVVNINTQRTRHIQEKDNEIDQLIRANNKEKQLLEEKIKRQRGSINKVIILLVILIAVIFFILQKLYK